MQKTFHKKFDGKSQKNAIISLIKNLLNAKIFSPLNLKNPSESSPNPERNQKIKADQDSPLSMTRSMINGWQHSNLFLAQKTQQEERIASFCGENFF